MLVNLKITKGYHSQLLRISSEVGQPSISASPTFRLGEGVEERCEAGICLRRPEAHIKGDLQPSWSR